MNQHSPQYNKQFWNERYDSEEYLYGEKPNGFLVESLEFLKGKKKILCLSEGEGRNSVFLASHGFEVTAVDLSSVARDKALALAKKNGVSIDYQVTDLSDFDFGKERWDAIVSIFGHLPSELRKKIHQSIRTGLKKEGVFLLEGYTPEQLDLGTGGPKNLDMLYVKEDLESDFSGFSILVSEVLNRDIHEGSGHTGESSVIQFIVKKP
ncbi:MAG: methyltransferase type 11 [Bdellovibrionaceae bacterium]|nr:methyltransferase type 11 [Pseudobdellovibrionaceae bacterium]|tara:strand:- start:2736 stop:3359 length:624 start_codon:yes stop_codon:yes gene_type:complete